MWYGVFLWAVVSSLAFHVPAALLALFTLRHHKYGRFMSVSVLLMGIVGPITAGTLTSTARAGAVLILRERVGWRCSLGWSFPFWLYFPLAPRLKGLDPVSGPAPGIPNVPSGCRAKGPFTFLSTWRKISQVWCQCPDLGNVCSLWAVGIL